MKKLKMLLALVLSAVMLCACGAEAANDAAVGGEPEKAPEPADKSALETAITSAEGIDTEGSLTADYLLRAIEKAKTVANDDSATQKEVDYMTEMLGAASEGLYSGADFKDPSEIKAGARSRPVPVLERRVC